MRRVLVLLLFPLSGCSTAAFSNNVAAPSSGGGGSTVGELRRVFVAGLVAPPGAVTTAGHPAPRSFARGRMMVEVRRDSTVQYRLDISNPAGETFTGASVHRRVANAVGPAVIALFSEAAIKEREIEVRGTGVVLDPRGPKLLDDLRGNPRDYVIVVRSRRVSGASLTGTVE